MKFLLALLSCSLLAAVFAAVPTPAAETKSVITKQKFRCPDFCTDLWNPVCGKNDKCIVAFGNPCKLDAYNCNRQKRDRFNPVDRKLCNNFSNPNFFYCY